MSKIDYYGLVMALAEKTVDEMDYKDLIQFAYEMKFNYFDDMSKKELLDEVDFVGIDINQFVITEGE